MFDTISEGDKHLPAKPSIQQRVTAGRKHCEYMQTEECEVVVGPAYERHLQVLQQVDQVQWQPADNKH